ncbi:hypothetical protein [Caulobacter sp. 17J80-11]|uniref:hypothetical protein n=1 Tax=Caulobacter sp. 17J80-11 TaxID=2763502 RepID=UPI0016538553|nr:hypothetical protein [Caulobacter sp. 17J80-11]MBC6980964.1 hypothetical protein [Caulobacter sp. 17J80-11]
MDAQRFESLTAAYGADPARWPQAEREAALAFQREHRAQAERLLFEARMIDAALAEVPIQVATADLRERVLASVPRAKTKPERRRHFMPAWLPGAGLAAACAVGVLAGSMAVERVAAPVQADQLVAEAAPTMDELEVAG